MSLNAYGNSAQWVRKQEIDKWLDVIIREQQQSVLSDCGLLGIVSGIQKHARAAHDASALSSVKGLDSDTVSAVVRRFYSLLLLLGPTSERFKLLGSPVLFGPGLLQYQESGWSGPGSD